MTGDERRWHIAADGEHPVVIVAVGMVVHAVGKVAQYTYHPAVNLFAVVKDAGSYDCIFIGFPVWWYTAPTIINTFIEAYGFEGKTVILFATSGGSTVDKANKDFAAAYPAINWKPGKTLNGASKNSLKTWVEGFGLR